MSRLKRLVLLFVLLCFSACGGGTIGTDEGNHRTYSGTIVDANGTPVARVKVLDLRAGNETDSDERGAFYLT